MNYRFVKLARKTCIGVSLAVVCGGFTACKDDYTLDDPGNYPSWLGGSIYEALAHPENLKGANGEVLTGTFHDYLRLIDDLGYTETMSKTGSKTVFPANDSAFARFYKKNNWGVQRYEDLTVSMKKLLLYSSMLDNALLVEMLSNVSDGSTAVTQGMALKHVTGVNVIDTITFLKSQKDMPVNNRYWEKYYDKGIHLVMDATRPMMVHFTEEQMTVNDITTRGTNSDFEVITGTPYSEQDKSAYIFRDRIISSDVTCKNGYIHQMEDLIVPPGNLAELIRTNGESKLFSRMLDRFCAPYYDATTTKNYNDYAQVNGLPLIDSIFQMRYFSQRSQDEELTTDPNRTKVQHFLPFDPGWNSYNKGGNGVNPVSDIATMFVPTDSALANFFLKGEGLFLMEAFGKQPNKREYLEENIDSIPLQNVQQLVSNLMKSSFVDYVPSKFGHVMDEANDPMGISLSTLSRNADGTYNVKIANNGVAYMLNKMFAPPSLIAVSAPVTLNSNMHIMNWAVNDGKGGNKPLALDQNYYAYLLAMSANFAFFIPTDDAFARYYIDPVYLNDKQPRVLKFYYQNKSPYVYCSAWKYDKATGEIGDSIGKVSTDKFRTQFVDILNYHTIVLAEGDTLGSNRYYKTKHGGAIRFDGNKVVSGAQIEGTAPVSNIKQVYKQANGRAYALDHVIQAPQRSVYDVLDNDPNFSEFMELCTDAVMDSVMSFASDRLNEKNEVTKKKRMDAYHPFAAKNGLTDNVNYFNSYNYTVFAPDNAAMQKAYDRGLPKWSEVRKDFDKYNDQLDREKGGGHISEEVQAARDRTLAMVEEINAFIRYHFQDNSVYVDNKIDAGIYPTACSDTLGIREKLTISSDKAGEMIVTDKFAKAPLRITEDGSKLVNVMTRDYVLDTKKHEISTSSFAVIHQISTPLCPHEYDETKNPTGRYDTAWTGAGARQRLKAFRQQYESSLYKRYDQNY